MTIMMKTPKVTRRNFLVGSAAAGGGLAIGLELGGFTDAFAQGARNASADVGIWVRIKPNNDIIVRTARSEMGQGTVTGLAQLIVEELEGDWKKVKFEYVTPGESHAKKAAWGDFNTVGSRGIRNSHDYVRRGGAVARTMLIQAAAERWKVPAAEIKAENSVLTHAKTGRKLTYGQVAAAASKLTPPDPKSMTLKDPKTWKIAGKPLARLDTPDKLTGKQPYTTDIKLPGMLSAVVIDAPVFNTKVRSFDDSKAKTMPGVKKVVKVGNTGVAVVADTWWHAKKAMDAVKITYEDTPNSKVQQATIWSQLQEGLTSKQGVFTANRQGDALKAIESAPRKFEATYQTQYVNHATMEPMSCVARYSPDKCEVWVGTQNGQGAHAAAARVAGLPLDKVEVYKQLLGGGFGRRARTDYVEQAVDIAKQMPGTPVKLIWTREEDMVQGRYRPIGMCKLTAGLDANGDLQGLHIRLSAPSILTSVRPAALGKDGSDPTQFQGWFPGGTESPFGYMAVPNILIEAAMRNTHVPVSFWRGVNCNQHAVFTECFIEEVAKAAGKDPIEFRRKILAKNPKHLGIFNAVIEKADVKKPLAAGRHRGVSVFSGYGSYCAAVAEVSVSDRGRAKVHRLIVGTNCGHVVNPDQVRAQIEGSVAYGLGALFHQENTVKDGAMVEKNFDTFPSLLMDEMPRIESVLAPTNDFWGGVGEPTIMVAAPAVLNAIFHATGKMPRSMPLKSRNLRA
jgi:isoquinoline 1-oxidoreductase beta subunit